MRDDGHVLMTVSTTHSPATDLGFLLVKHPDRVHRFDVPAGQAAGTKAGGLEERFRPVAA